MTQDIDDDEDYEDDQWETVSFEREKWARLMEVLELLTELSLVMGRSLLKLGIPVVFVDQQYCDEEEDRVKGSLNVKKMKIKMQFGGTCSLNITMASLWLLYYYCR